MADAIDITDYAVLQAVHETGCPLWKKRVYDYIMGHIDRFPGVTSVSQQTVGRHVDKMQDAGYLETDIVSPDELNRDLVIGYTITDQGVDALAAKRADLLERTIINHMFPDKSNVRIKKGALLEMMTAHFDIPVDVREALSGFTRNQLVTVLMMGYARSEVDQQLAEGDIQKIRARMDETQELWDAFQPTQ